MMGRNHAASGLAGSMVIALPFSPGVAWPLASWLGWWPAIPIPVLLLAVVLTGGAAYLPDIDHPSSTVAHSLGWVTKVISRGVAWASRTVYYATAGPRDKPSCGTGHRYFTHVPVGALTFGLMTLAAVAWDPIAAAVVIGLVTALLANGFVRGGVALLVVCGGAAWFVTDAYPGWWWVWPVAVALGCHIHREGDWCTVNGVPRRSWPRMVAGRRWDRHSAPFAFKVNSDAEHGVAKPIIWVTFAVATIVAAGVAPLLVTGVGALSSAVAHAVAGPDDHVTGPGPTPGRLVADTTGKG